MPRSKTRGISESSLCVSLDPSVPYPYHPYGIHFQNLQASRRMFMTDATHIVQSGTLCGVR